MIREMRKLDKNKDKGKGKAKIQQFDGKARQSC